MAFCATLAALLPAMEHQANSGDVSPTENIPSERLIAHPSGDASAVVAKQIPTSNNSGTSDQHNANEPWAVAKTDAGADQMASQRRRLSVSFDAAPPKVIEFIR